MISITIPIDITSRQHPKGVSVVIINIKVYLSGCRQRLRRIGMSKYIITLVALFAVSLCVTGCENDAQNTALIGAGVGALIGGDDAATGAAIGAGAGYLIGNESDKNKSQQQTDQQMAQIRAEQQVVSVWITNSNGSKSEVRLRRSGPSYIGPKGETYTSMPTEDQLRSVYGF
jgi:hypothetical protein